MHPLQRDCDPNDPKQFAAWAFAGGIPDPSPVRPQPIPLISPQLVAGLSEMLWEFGFRHHEDLQEKWISGGAGLGMVSNITKDKPKVDPVEKLAEDFLSEHNPKLLDAVRKAPPEERDKLIKDLEKNSEVLQQMIQQIKNVKQD